MCLYSEKPERGGKARLAEWLAIGHPRWVFPRFQQSTLQESPKRLKRIGDVQGNIMAEKLVKRANGTFPILDRRGAAGAAARVIVLLGLCRESCRAALGVRRLPRHYLGAVLAAPERPPVARAVRALRLLPRTPGEQLLLPGAEALLPPGLREVSPPSSRGSVGAQRPRDFSSLLKPRKEPSGASPQAKLEPLKIERGVPGSLLLCRETRVSIGPIRHSQDRVTLVRSEACEGEVTLNRKKRFSLL